MIAVDTNVLLRYLLGDEPGQSDKARALIVDNDVLVTDVVLAETLWVLQGRRYRASRADLLAVLSGLIEDTCIQFENAAVVWRAYRDFASTPADFQDALIMHKAHALEATGELRLYTFDRAAAQLSYARQLQV